MKLLADLLGCAIETGVMFYFYQYFLKNPKVESKYMAAVYLLDYIICVIYATVLDVPAQKIICSVIAFALPLFFYRGKNSFKLILLVIYVTIQCLAELLIKAVLLGYRGDFLVYYAAYEYNYFLGVVMSKIIALVLVYLCTFLFQIRDQKLPTYLYGLLMLVPVSSFVIFYYLQDVVFLVNTKAVYLGYSVITLLLFLFNLLFFFLFAKVTQVSWLQTKLAYEKELLQEEQKYYKSMATYQQKIRQLYHDINNHFLILYDALTQNHTAKAKLYVEQQLQALAQDKMTYSGYLLLDTVLFYKEQLANQQQTKYTVQAVLSSQLELADDLLNDFALVLATCLDNALEATAKLQDPQQRWIKISLRNDQNYLYLQITNSVQENIAIPKQALPPTTKKDTLLHGLGLQQVKHLTERHHGQLLLDCQEQVFSVVLMVQYRQTK